MVHINIVETDSINSYMRSFRYYIMREIAGSQKESAEKGEQHERNEKYQQSRSNGFKRSGDLSGGNRWSAKTLAQNEHVSVTLFSFDKGEEISTHESGGDAFVTCLDGVGKVTIDGVEYILHEGESIVMPAKHPHAVYGEEQFKMLLVVIF